MKVTFKSASNKESVYKKIHIYFVVYLILDIYNKNINVTFKLSSAPLTPF